jgi:hypothetical protein
MDNEAPEQLAEKQSAKIGKHDGKRANPAEGAAGLAARREAPTT